MLCLNKSLMNLIFAIPFLVPFAAEAQNKIQSSSSSSTSKSKKHSKNSSVKSVKFQQPGVGLQKVNAGSRGSAGPAQKISSGSSGSFTKGTGAVQSTTSVDNNSTKTNLNVTTAETNSKSGQNTSTVGTQITTQSQISTGGSNTSSSLSSSAGSKSSGGSSTSGSCLGPSKCDGSEPAYTPTYSWKIPTYSGVMTMSDRFLSLHKDGFNLFEQPKLGCDANSDGKLMAVDFGPGIGKLAVVCMSDAPKDLAKYIKSVSGADPGSLPVEVAHVKDQYKWVLTRKPTQSYGFSNGLPLCNSDNFGMRMEPGLGAEYTCMKVDGHLAYETTPDPYAPNQKSEKNDQICKDWQATEVRSCVNGVEYGTIRGCKPPGHDDPNLWVTHSDGSFSHMTGKSCVSACEDWQAAEVRSCVNGVEYGTIRGCIPPGHNDPNLWVTHSDGSFSHMTGRSCGTALSQDPKSTGDDRGPASNGRSEDYSQGVQ